MGTLVAQPTSNSEPKKSRAGASARVVEREVMDVLPCDVSLMPITVGS